MFLVATNEVTLQGNSQIHCRDFRGQSRELAKSCGFRPYSDDNF